MDIQKKGGILIALIIACWFPQAAFSAELTAIHNARLIDSPSNDGDSFVVAINEERLHLRLYYVDCAETQFGGKADIKRIREQARHFGVTQPRTIVNFGKEAKQYVENILSKPFVIYTSYASALGRAAGGRIYGFVKTQEGKYLSDMLVEKGLARIHGQTRENPDGVASEIVLQRLRDLETAAVLRRAGLWKESDPAQLIQMRALQQQEEQELDALRDDIAETRSIDDQPLDPNVATSEQLQSIKGIGPVIAEKIILGRPYHSVDELLKVHGIAPKTLKEITPYFIVKRRSGREK